MDTTDAGERACSGGDVFDGGADLGGDGLLLDEQEVGFDHLGCLGFVVWREKRGIGFLRVGVFSLERCGGGSFNHGEGSYDIAKGVGNLMAEYY